MASGRKRKASELDYDDFAPHLDGPWYRCAVALKPIGENALRQASRRILNISRWTDLKQIRAQQAAEEALAIVPFINGGVGQVQDQPLSQEAAHAGVIEPADALGFVAGAQVQDQPLEAAHAGVIEPADALGFVAGAPVQNQPLMLEAGVIEPADSLGIVAGVGGPVQYQPLILEAGVIEPADALGIVAGVGPVQDQPLMLEAAQAGVIEPAQDEPLMLGHDPLILGRGYADQEDPLGYAGMLQIQDDEPEAVAHDGDEATKSGNFFRVVWEALIKMWTSAAKFNI